MFFADLLCLIFVIKILIRKLVIFYNESLTTKVVLWSFFMSETSEKSHNSTFLFLVWLKFFQILWKSRCYILVGFPSHLKKLRSIPRFWLEKLNCGFFHSFHSWKKTTNQFSRKIFIVKNIYFKRACLRFRDNFVQCNRSLKMCSFLWNIEQRHFF